MQLKIKWEFLQPLPVFWRIFLHAVMNKWAEDELKSIRNTMTVRKHPQENNEQLQNSRLILSFFMQPCPGLLFSSTTFYLLIKVAHCKFKRSVSAPKWQSSPEAPGADAAHCGAISVTAGSKQSPLETDPAHSGPNLVLWCRPSPLTRAIMALTSWVTNYSLILARNFSVNL